ncbi:MAG: DUF2007 domain-containing protein [Pedosphaera sp.]|nr:DUF2007 domain-containing protein [Pedosphaera sp.]
MNFQTIATTFSPVEAQLLASRLRAEGLYVYVHSELAAHAIEGYSMSVGGLRIQVPEDQAETAKEILAAKDPETQAPDSV